MSAALFVLFIFLFVLSIVVSCLLRDKHAWDLPQFSFPAFAILMSLAIIVFIMSCKYGSIQEMMICMKNPNVVIYDMPEDDYKNTHIDLKSPNTIVSDIYYKCSTHDSSTCGCKRDKKCVRCLVMSDKYDIAVKENIQ